MMMMMMIGMNIYMCVFPFLVTFFGQK